MGVYTFTFSFARGYLRVYPLLCKVSQPLHTVMPALLDNLSLYHSHDGIGQGYGYFFPFQLSSAATRL